MSSRCLAPAGLVIGALGASCGGHSGGRRVAQIPAAPIPAATEGQFGGAPAATGMPRPWQMRQRPATRAPGWARMTLQLPGPEIAPCKSESASKPAAGHWHRDGRQPSAQSSRAATALASDDSEHDLNDAHARGRDGQANEHKHKRAHATDQPAFQVVRSLLLNSGFRPSLQIKHAHGECASRHTRRTELREGFPWQR